MKRKLILVLALLVVAAMFTSCIKDCVCDVKFNGIESAEGGFVGKMTKYQCKSYGDFVWGDNSAYEYDCHLE
ncbi:MAG TPA: hypothetical protein PLH70_01950 [Bacteroidales bacterium]|nr:hypothetical protein [Bacteroidales bacterium]HQB74548.1 hypothetical protein [Bacteroidales bacterium]